jgi:hypothetical protein
MTTNMTFNLNNADCAVKASGRIVKKGYRYNPASDNRQAVANIKMEFRRAWDANRGQGAPDWKDVKSIIDFDVWGTNAERFDAAMQGLDGKKVIVEIGFSLADFKTSIWGKHQDMTEMKCRATSARIINVGEYHGGEGETEYAQAPAGASEPASEEAVEVEL